MGENASDALKMAAAILLFVMALSVAIFAFSKAKTSAEKTMEKLDGTFLFYDTDNMYIDYMNGGLKTTKISINQQAIIDKSQFMVNVFNYYTSGYTLLFYYVDSSDLDINVAADGTHSITLKNDATIHKMPLYYSEASSQALNRSILRVNPTNYELNVDGSVRGTPGDTVLDAADPNEYRAIYGLDISDEISRQEQWIYNKAFLDKFIQDMVMGYVSYSPTCDVEAGKNLATYYTDSKRSHLSLNIYDRTEDGQAFRYWFRYKYVNYTGGKSFMESDCRFIQRIGTYNYESSSDIQTSTTLTEEQFEELKQQLIEGGYSDVGQIVSLTDVDPSEDLLSNLETIDNYGGAEKKVVQYIYIGESDIYS